jgi:hypothetical protein
MTDPRPDVELEAAVDPELERLLGDFVSGVVQVGTAKRPFDVPRQEHIAFVLGCDWIEVTPDGYEFQADGHWGFARDIEELKADVQRIRTRRR